jgi:hypothetical protein
MDEKVPWSGMIAATKCLLHAQHVTPCFRPRQFNNVFSRDAILNVKHITDWEHIHERKQDHAIKNNKRKNKNRRNHFSLQTHSVQAKGASEKSSRTLLLICTPRLSIERVHPNVTETVTFLPWAIFSRVNHKIYSILKKTVQIEDSHNHFHKSNNKQIEQQAKRTTLQDPC